MMMNYKERISCRVWDQVSEQDWVQVQGRVYSQVSDQVWVQVYEQVYDQVYDQMEEDLDVN